VTKRITEALSDGQNGINHRERRTYCLNFETAVEQRACCTYVTCVAHETISNAGMPNRNIVPLFLYAAPCARPRRMQFRCISISRVRPLCCAVRPYTCLHGRVCLLPIKMRHGLYLHSYPRS